MNGIPETETAPERLPLTSGGPTDERVRQLRELFPEAFSEGELDLERLAAALGVSADPGVERYELRWAGKQEARLAVRALSTGTLQPLRERSVAFDTTENAIVEGDNLEVLRLLQKAYHGRVGMIYIDPPYNTGNDFIYADDFREGLREYLRFSGQADEQGLRASTNTESSGRFHSRWLSMMYPRLHLARNLLREDGAICVSIGEEELHHLRLLLDEVFGVHNYRNTLLVRRYDKNINTQFAERGLPTLNVGAEYVVIYARSEAFTFNPVYRPAPEERRRSGYWKGFWNAADRPTMRYELLGVQPETGQWKWSEEKAREAVASYEDFLASGTERLEDYWEQTGRKLRFIRRQPGGRGKNEGVEHWVPPATGILRNSNWTDLLASSTLRGLDLDFSSPKNPELIQELIRLCSDDGDLVLDFFAGSGTTAEAVLRLNAEGEAARSFLLVQLPEPTEHGTISDITHERVRRVAARLAESTGDGAPQDRGFRAFRLAPSNFKLWDADAAPRDAEGLARQLARYADHLVPGRSQEDVLFELLLKAGLPLSATVEPLALDGGAYSVAGGALVVCLEERMSTALVEAIAARQPEQVLCLDHAFDDALKINARLAFESAGIAFWTV